MTVFVKLTRHSIGAPFPPLYVNMAQVSQMTGPHSAGATTVIIMAQTLENEPETFYVNETPEEILNMATGLHMTRWTIP